MTGFPYRHDVEVVALLASPVHRYDGRPAGPVPQQDGDRRGAIGVRAGYGVVGDRYAGRPAHRDAQLTVLAVEALEAVAAETGAAPFDPHLARRTVVLRGAEVEALRGQRFALDSGFGPVLLIAAGAVLVVAPRLIGLSSDLGLVLGVAAVVGGVSVLVSRMRERSTDDGDDGAVV